MVFFITCLRALAACLITNAHYSGIYPSDLIANGGLVGDVLFFAVSGYCLCNVKTSFARWYGKRVYRVYLPVLVMTVVYVLIGCYSLEEHSAFWWFVYPTCYHFVASIVVLYVPFYFCMKMDVLKKHLPIVAGGVAIVCLILYFTVYDRGYYHIDTVREPMIRFLFMESMLLGAWFKQHDQEFRSRFKMWYPIATLGMFLVYFASKLLFSRRQSLAEFQILNQFAIFALLILVFMTFMGLDAKLEEMPQRLKKVIRFISSITLEIYLVQNVLIAMLRPIGHFPVNWVVLTTCILAAAFLLHKVCELIYKLVDIILEGGGNL